MNRVMIVNMSIDIVLLVLEQKKEKISEVGLIFCLATESRNTLNKWFRISGGQAWNWLLQNADQKVSSLHAVFSHNAGRKRRTVWSGRLSSCV
jgi:hypothetical protein